MYVNMYIPGMSVGWKAIWLIRVVQTMPQHTATHCNTLQHAAAHCNTPQHTATHCNTRVFGLVVLLTSTFDP